MAAWLMRTGDCQSIEQLCENPRLDALKAMKAERMGYDSDLLKVLIKMLGGVNSE